jgi:glycosyltransferase involved in cell wall biosynthesis
VGARDNRAAHAAARPGDASLELAKGSTEMTTSHVPPATVRVMHVVLALRPGGTERLVVEMARRAPRWIEPSVACLDEAGEWAAILEERGIPVTTLGRRPGFHPGLGGRLAQLAHARDAHVLHCHQYTPFVYGALAKLARPRTRLVFTEHGRLADAPPSSRRRLANAILGRVPGRFFAVSAELRAFLEAEGFPRGRVEVLPNGIDLGPPPSAEGRARARHALGVDEDAILLGTAARLDPVKDLRVLVAAVARLRVARAPIRLVILGEGPERASLEREIAAHDLGAAVLLAGHRPDVRDLLPGFDIYVNSSTYEGVSLTILEAMAAALPVVATAVGGNPEVVEDGRTGLLVPPRDAARLASALGALIADPARRRSLGEAGRKRAEERFAFERMMSMYLEAYLPN